jgi:predicted acylesterase/phospholipase RssA
MPFDTYDLVFEGGGAKGSVFVGALEEFFAAGLKARRLIGTSAGAITATLLAAGYTPEEMLAAVNEKLDDGKPRFSSFMDPPERTDFSEEEIAGSVTMEVFRRIPIPDIFHLDERLLHTFMDDRQYRQLFSFVECGGLFAGMKFLEWLREKLAAKGVAPGATLAQMFEQKQVDLSLVATDTTDVEMLVLNHRTAPDVPVEWAVRMSMSIPFVWREVVWRADWGTYRNRGKLNAEGGKGNIIVDGGVLSNFPIRLVADDAADDEFVADVMGRDTNAAAAGNLGLLIDENLAVAGQPSGKPPSVLSDLRTARRVGRLVDTMMQAQDDAVIRDHESEVCRLPAKGYGTTEFDMPQPRLDALVEAGRQAMKTYLAALV